MFLCQIIKEVSEDQSINTEDETDFIDTLQEKAAEIGDILLLREII